MLMANSRVWSIVFVVFDRPILGRSYLGTRFGQGSLKCRKKCAIAGAMKMLIKREIRLAKWLSTLSGKKSHELASWLWKEWLLWFSSVCAVSVWQVLWPQLLNGHYAGQWLQLSAPAPETSKPEFKRNLPKMMPCIIRLQTLGPSLRILAAEGKGLTNRQPWVVSDGAVSRCVPAVPILTVEPASAPASLPEQGRGPGEAGTLDYELQQPGTAAARPLGGGVWRSQSRKRCRSSWRMRRRAEAASRNRPRERVPCRRLGAPASRAPANQPAACCWRGPTEKPAFQPCKHGGPQGGNDKMAGVENKIDNVKGKSVR